MRSIRHCLVLAGLILPAVAAAQEAKDDSKPASPHTVTGNVTFATQYIFRGLTQTSGKPALQGGLDYSHASGLYVGTWASNVSWYKDQNAGSVSAPVALSSPASLGPPYDPGKTNSFGLEWDFYGGYKGELAKDWTYDLGGIRYSYPGSYDNTGAYRRPDTTELYAGIGYRWLSLKYSKAISKNTFGTNDSRGADYIDLSGTIPLAESGFNLLAHVGRQRYPDRPNALYFGASGGNNTFYSYTDYKLGLTKDWRGFTWAAAWTYAGTRATAPDGQTTAYRNVHGNNIGGSRVTLSVTKTF